MELVYKMKKNKIFIIIIGILLFSLLIGTVSAITPTPSEITGNWPSSEYPVFSENGETRLNLSGFANYTYGTVSITNNTGGLTLPFTIMELLGDRVEWWHLAGVKRTWIALELRNGNESVWAWLYAAHEQGVILRTNEVLITTHSIRGSNAYGWEIFNFENGHYEFQVIRQNNNLAEVRYGVNLRGGGSGITQSLAGATYATSENFTVSDSFWNNFTVNLYVSHEGTGKFQYFVDELIVQNSPIDPIQTGLAPQTEDWITKTWQFITGIWDILTQMFSLAVTLFLAIVPWLPWLFLFWLIDVIIKSINTGSFTPIGYALQAIIGFITQVYALVISLLQAIAELIPL